MSQVTSGGGSAVDMQSPSRPNPGWASGPPGNGNCSAALRDFPLSDIVVAAGEPTALARLSSALEVALAGRGAAYRRVVFACIGTDRSTGDALGPLSGQKLSRLGCPDGDVVGTLEHPLHALNLAERIQPLADLRPAPLIVAVDAALGRAASVGQIQLRAGGILPGQGVGKALPEIGELSLIGTVNIAAPALQAQVLQSTRLFVVQGMADTIGVSLWWALRTLRRRSADTLVESPGASAAVRAA